MTKKIREELERWEKTTLQKVISKAPERQPSFKTTSLIEMKRLYTPLDTEDIDYCGDLSFPGEHPFTRGVQPTMYRGRLWTMRQYAGFATAEETNKRYKFLLEQG
ncbi:MAG: methylmalonyl-CoA mutase family protein, partial [Thermodesulfobacteriota bacterium]|nr:methylmalonyl-CoA mutase family protein [Thermodesulfobacteriota bacterium]